MDRDALECVDRALKSVINAIGERPDELIRALNTLHGKEAGYPDPLYMSPPERERVIRGAAQAAGLDICELLLLYRTIIQYEDR